ncbi:MAG: hypothetical protein GY940_42390, partial [bacterium]|nr:hypothetical protein [bacterium]
MKKRRYGSRYIRHKRYIRHTHHIPQAILLVILLLLFLFPGFTSLSAAASGTRKTPDNQEV